MVDTSEEKNVERRGDGSDQAPLLDCPFCGDKGEYYYKQYSGTGASGMEPPSVYAGCKKCAISFGGGDTQGWSAEKGWFDRSKEAHVAASEKWNHRAI